MIFISLTFLFLTNYISLQMTCMTAVIVDRKEERESGVALSHSPQIVLSFCHFCFTFVVSDYH